MEIDQNVRKNNISWWVCKRIGMYCIYTWFQTAQYLAQYLPQLTQLPISCQVGQKYIGQQ